jgi:hypothetical protein
MNQLLAGLKDKASRGGADISKWYARLDPAMKATIQRGLIGAAGGAALTGGIAAATPRDPEDKGGVVGPALLGALLGGAGGALLPYGAKMLSGGAGAGDTNKRPMGARAFETVTAPLAWHPLMFGGGIYGAAKARPIISEAMKATKAYRAQGGSGLRGAKEVLFNGSHPFWAKKQVMDAAGKGWLKGSPRGRLAMLPLLAGLGYAGDKYLKGEW